MIKEGSCEITKKLKLKSKNRKFRGDKDCNFSQLIIRIIIIILIIITIIRSRDQILLYINFYFLNRY